METEQKDGVTQLHHSRSANRNTGLAPVQEVDEELRPPARKLANWAMGILLTLCIADVLVRLVVGPKSTAASWTVWCISLTAFVLGVAINARRLPSENAIGAGLATLILCFAYVGIAARNNDLLSGIVFGGGLGFSFLGLFPFSLPFLIAGSLLASREAARSILRPWRRSNSYGYSVLAISSSLFVLLHAGFESIAVAQAGWWTYPEASPESGALLFCGAPVGVHIAWLLFAFLTLALASAWLLKRRVWYEPPHWQGPGFYMTLIAWVMLNNILHGAMQAAVLEFVTLAVVALGAFRSLNLARQKLTERDGRVTS